MIVPGRDRPAGRRQAAAPEPTKLNSVTLFGAVGDTSKRYAVTPGEHESVFL